MKFNHFEIENISEVVRHNIQDKFRGYTQEELKCLYRYNLPAFARWNNRNE